MLGVAMKIVVICEPDSLGWLSSSSFLFSGEHQMRVVSSFSCSEVLSEQFDAALIFFSDFFSRALPFLSQLKDLSNGTFPIIVLGDRFSDDYLISLYNEGADCVVDVGTSPMVFSAK